MDEVLNPSEVAKLLRMHVKTIHRLAMKGHIPGKRIGRSWRFRKSVILAMISPRPELVRETIPVEDKAVR